MFYIILVALLMIAFVSFICLFYYQKFQYYTIRTNEAEGNIDILLQKKIEYITQIIPIIQSKSKEKDFLDKFQEIREKERDHFEINEYLKNSYLEIIKIIDDHEKLLKDKKFVEIIESIEDNEEDLVASIKFYNDNAIEFNHLVQSFPSNIIRIFLHFKKMDLYSTERKEIFEILKK